MSSCNHCQDLNIPSYQIVAQSRPPERNFSTSRAIPSDEPRGLKPFINIAIDAILNGDSEAQCDTCIMFRSALLAMYSGFLDDLTEIECKANISNTLDVTVVQKSGVEERFEFYTFSDSPSKWPRIGAGRSVLPDSSSDECTEIAASCIRDCLENHKDCLQFDQTPLPWEEHKYKH